MAYFNETMIFSDHAVELFEDIFASARKRGQGVRIAPASYTKAGNVKEVIYKVGGGCWSPPVRIYS